MNPPRQLGRLARCQLRYGCTKKRPGLFPNRSCGCGFETGFSVSLFLNRLYHTTPEKPCQQFIFVSKSSQERLIGFLSIPFAVFLLCMTQRLPQSPDLFIEPIKSFLSHQPCLPSNQPQTYETIENKAMYNTTLRLSIGILQMHIAPALRRPFQALPYRIFRCTSQDGEFLQG